MVDNTMNSIEIKAITCNEIYGSFCHLSSIIIMRTRLDSTRLERESEYVFLSYFLNANNILLVFSLRAFFFFKLKSTHRVCFIYAVFFSSFKKKLKKKTKLKMKKNQ